MYTKNCEYCGKEFKSQAENAKYCTKYHGGKARRVRYLEKKESMNTLEKQQKMR